MTPPERFIGYYRLIEAFDQRGCPVCRVVEGDGRRHLEALIYEEVTDPDLRRRLHGSRGFCNWHTWMLVELDDTVSGAAILYEDLVRVVAAEVERRRRDSGQRWSARPGVVADLLTWWRRRRRRYRSGIERSRTVCPTCLHCSEREAAYVDAMIEHVSDDAFALAYGRGDGLCAPHALLAIERTRGGSGLATLLDRTLVAWTRLHHDLTRFVSKHDYRNRERYTEEEATSYSRAFEMVAGRRGVYGNDLHASPEPGTVRLPAK